MTRKDFDTHMSGWKDKIQCYNCGRFGHFRNECRAPKKPDNGNNGRGNGAVRPLHYNSRHRRMERRKKNVGADASNMEAGAYFDVVVHNQPTKFLIDTGATIYNKKPFFSGKIGCYRISAAEDISIPPGTEAFSRDRHYEPCEKFVKRDNALLAKTLVEAREHVPIRLLNVSNNVTTIRAGTIVGEISPVEDVITMTGNTSKEHKSPKLDNELQKLVNEASSHLTEKQRHQVEVEESDRPKSAFATRRGLFQFRKMPFGLACDPAIFERLMERVMAGLQ
ncbi:unnamed protein product [Mytilus edulis]|uniref:CCHC-type domain-containing protein n=1 Tax=Mytilus edulis TaxID=6550 RepID=A0A8S3UZ79_MYTED|nr:unnamed protein product [Mytilus edulis]